jgi:hypothetical protein
MCLLAHVLAAWHVLGENPDGPGREQGQHADAHEDEVDLDLLELVEVQEQGRGDGLLDREAVEVHLRALR